MCLASALKGEAAPVNSAGAVGFTAPVPVGWKVGVRVEGRGDGTPVAPAGVEGGVGPGITATGAVGVTPALGYAVLKWTSGTVIEVEP
jgi:hypothetical protein